MAQLIYSGIMSLDGYVADSAGNFDWAAPDEEVHGFINDLERDVGTYLYGRRMYQVMQAWETFGGPEEPEVVQDFGRIWRAADKVVYSNTLAETGSDRTRIERTFDPGAVRLLKENSPAPLGIGGPTLAAHALRTGLVDECQLFITPVAVGGGLRFLPEGLQARFELLGERRFGNGMVFLRYRAS